MIKHSEHQLSIFKHIKNPASGNLLIESVAGSGKTTTIVESLKYIHPNFDVLFLAFNKSNVEALKERVPKHIEVKTLHSLGFQALTRIGKDKIDDFKINNLIKGVYNKFGVKPKDQSGFTWRIKNLVDFIRQHYLDLDTQTVLNRTLEYGHLYNEKDVTIAFEILESSLKSPVIDFIDMVYLPVKLDLKLKKFDYVCVDEVQDLNTAQILLFLKTKKQNGKHICVGDSRQAIYGFAGSDINSFSKLRGLPNTTVLPLTVCYRCKTNIVTFAQRIVPDIQSNNNLDEGVVRNGSIEELKDGDLVLCRNTKPLFELALKLFSLHKKCYIKGQEFGKELVNMLLDTKTDNKESAVIKLEYQLAQWEKKLNNYGIVDAQKAPSYRSLVEKCDIIENVIFERVNSVKQAIELIKTLFNEKEDHNRVTLSTIHRAKGFEADRVFILNSSLMPSKFATLDWEIEQENNLMYVAYTRAKDELIFIEFQKDKNVCKNKE